MKYIGVIGVLALVGMFFYTLKSRKSPYDEEEVEKILKENREKAFSYMQRVKDKRQ